MDFHKIIYIVKVIEIVVWQLSLIIKITAVLFLLMFLGSFYIMFISPIYFNYFLIPQIEKQVGEKLVYHPYVDYIFLGRWMCRQVEISCYLRHCYRAYKKNGDKGSPKYSLRFALKKVSYTIGIAPRKAIIMSYALYVAMWVTAISGITGAIIFKTHPSMFNVNKPGYVQTKKLEREHNIP